MNDVVKNIVKNQMNFYNRNHPEEGMMTRTNYELIRFINDILKMHRNDNLNKEGMSIEQIEFITKSDIIKEGVTNLDELDINNTSQFVVFQKLDLDKITYVLHNLQVNGLIGKNESGEQTIPEYIMENIFSYIDDSEKNINKGNEKLEKQIIKMYKYFLKWLDERPHLAAIYADGVNKRRKARSKTNKVIKVDGCWTGYERVPGTIQYSKGSCRKKKSPYETSYEEKKINKPKTLIKPIKV